MVPWLPGILFGGLAIGGSLLILLLPETLNRPLPQTIEDIENWSKKSKDKSSEIQQNEKWALQNNVGGSLAPANCI